MQKPWTVLACCIIAAAVSTALREGPVAAASSFDEKRASFSVRFKNEVAAYEDLPAFILPNKTLTLDIVGGPQGTYEVESKFGRLVHRSARVWDWTAAVEPGTYELKVKGPSGAGDIDIHVFVLVPSSEQKDGALNGYRIGAYPASRNPIYAAPPGFIEVTKENEDARLTPHFRLKQFLCKQEPIARYPKYVVLQERLLLALEAVLAEANAHGFDVDTLHVMSAYRTPFYNAAIGDVPLSMHQFGGAADVFVDRHDKGVMDDLNRDGRVNVNDAQYLQTMVEQLVGRPAFRRFEGGMGVYPATSAHPPFVHVDVRGTKARWKG